MVQAMPNMWTTLFIFNLIMFKIMATMMFKSKNQILKNKIMKKKTKW